MIHKVQLPLVTPFSKVTMPKGWKPLAVQIQGADMPTLWIQFEPQPTGEFDEVHLELETFMWVGTGTGDDDRIKGEYLGTVQVRGFVWHLFRVLEYPKGSTSG